MSLNPTHLQIAARMQTLIEAWLDEPFDIERMLADPHECREVLFVCQASNQPELVMLAQQFVDAGRPMPPIPQKPPVPTRPAPAKNALRARTEKPARPAAEAPQDTAWSRDTSGFGVTDVPFHEVGARREPGTKRQSPVDAGERPGWFQRPKWLRRERNALNDA